MIDLKSKPCKVVYAVTSSGRDVYSVMTRVSVASIRISNPNFMIVLGCDEHSIAAMRQSRDPLLDEIDELLICRTPAGDNAFRNRFVKTKLRFLLDGPFLFLDSDTLVRDNISELFSLDTDIACAPVHSKDSIEQQIWDGDREILSIMGWSHRQDIFVNGGVIFYNDTRGAALFAENWHLKWLNSHAIAKRHWDQAALNAAIFDIAPRLKILSHRFNAQFRSSPAIASSAAIWHYLFTWSDKKPTTEVERLVLKLLKGDELQRSHVESIILHEHPWRRESWVDEFVARAIKNKVFLDDWASIWLRGYRMKSLIRLFIWLLMGRRRQRHIHVRKIRRLVAN